MGLPIVWLYVFVVLLLLLGLLLPCRCSASWGRAGCLQLRSCCQQLRRKSQRACQTMTLQYNS
jgi:hypothetical protein